MVVRLSPQLRKSLRWLQKHDPRIMGVFPPVDQWMKSEAPGINIMAAGHENNWLYRVVSVEGTEGIISFLSNCRLVVIVGQDKTYETQFTLVDPNMVRVSIKVPELGSIRLVVEHQNKPGQWVEVLPP